MNPETKELSNRQTFVIGLLFIMVSIMMYGLYTIQEKNAESTIQECPIITIAYPEKFVPQSRLYYYFYINGKKTNDNFIMPLPTMGVFERDGSLMKERFWIKVYCKDYNLNRIYWGAKVPDTLKFVPVMGWNNIPYDIAKTE